MEHTFQIGAISLIGNSICTGHAKDLFHGYGPKSTLDNLFDWRSNLDRPVRIKTNVPDPSLKITTLDFEGSSVLSRFACRHHCDNLDLVSMETHICLDRESHHSLVSVETHTCLDREGHQDLVSVETHMFGPGRSSGFGVDGDMCLDRGRSSGLRSVDGDMNLLGLHNSHAMQMQDDTDFRRSLCQNVAQNKMRHH